MDNNIQNSYNKEFYQEQFPTIDDFVAELRRNDYFEFATMLEEVGKRFHDKFKKTNDKF